MFSALADGVNVLVVAAGQAIGYQDATPHVQTGHAGQVDVGPDAGGYDNHLAVQRCAVLELQAGYFAVAQYGRGQLLQMEPDPQSLQALLEQLAGQRVQLHVHEPGHQVNDVHLDAAVHQPAGCFQPQQAAADYGRFPHLASVVDDFGAVVQGAKHEHAGLVGTIFFHQPVHRRHEGAAAGGDDQLVVGHQ